MMTLEIHPEELLDKAAAGTLTESERVWLDGHLAQCQVCRFERQARADFAAVSIDDVNVDALVSRALVGAQPAAERPGVTTLESRRRRRSVAILAGTALVFSTMASFAAVAQWTGVWPKIIHVFVPVPTPAPAPAPTVKKQPPPVAVQEPKVETVSGTPTALAQGKDMNVSQVAISHSNYTGDLAALRNDFKKKFNDDYYTFQTYLGLRMLSEGMAKAKSTDPVKVANAMSGLKFQGTVGEVEMRKADHQLQQHMFISKWTKADAKHPYSE